MLVYRRARRARRVSQDVVSPRSRRARRL